MPGPRPSPATTLAWRYLRGRGLRSALTTLAVALGVMLVFGLNGITPTLVEAFTRSMMSGSACWIIGAWPLITVSCSVPPDFWPTGKRIDSGAVIAA